uniref:Uncharacterized protein n=1 Tax=Arundo donax TaxID=35708 RepID=A0A0A9B7Q3_ARUDO
MKQTCPHRDQYRPCNYVFETRALLLLYINYFIEAWKEFMLWRDALEDIPFNHSEGLISFFQSTMIVAPHRRGSRLCATVHQLQSCWI